MTSSPTPAVLPAEKANSIIEESENSNGSRMATVTDNRGGEYVVNVDTAVIMLVQMLSNLANERRGGWSLNTGWYEAELAKFRTIVVRCAESTHDQ